MYCMTELNYLNKIDQIKSFKHLIKLYFSLIQKLYIYTSLNDKYNILTCNLINKFTSIKTYITM